MKYHHLGIPTKTPQPGEMYLEKYKVFCTDHENNPFVATLWDLPSARADVAQAVERTTRMNDEDHCPV
jgi:hypothetical protein